MKIILGLGNPGKPYEHTRHNVGFDTVDLLADLTDIHTAKNKLSALVAEGNYKGQRVALIKPQTFMNESGRAVVQALQWYHIAPQDCLIVSDDIDLPAGAVRLRSRGGAGTHNGWRSILTQTSSELFPRVRIGVGAPPDQWDLADWVLSRYKGAPDDADVSAAIDAAAKAALCWLSEGIDIAMNRFNTKRNHEPTV